MSGSEFNPEHADAAAGRFLSGLLSTSGQTVLGFIEACETCGQRAILDGQPESSWVCPRCADANPDLGAQPEVPLVLPGVNYLLVTDDDDYPIGKVQG